MTVRRHGGALLAILLMAPFLAQADATIVNVATPSIGAGLGASGATLQLVVGGYLIAFAVLLITISLQNYKHSRAQIPRPADRGRHSACGVDESLVGAFVG